MIFEQKRFADANKDYTSTGIKVFSIVSLMFPIMTLILSGTNMGIVWFGAKLIGDQEMGVGNLVSFMTYASMILFSFMMLSMVFVLSHVVKPRLHGSMKFWRCHFRSLKQRVIK